MIKSFLLLVMFGQLYAGDSLEFITPGQAFSAAQQLESEGEIEKAISLYLTISDNDTAFVETQSKLMPLYNSLDQYDQTISIGEKIKDDYTIYRKKIYINLGNAYLDNGETERSIQIYNEGLKLFPYSYILIYNLGLAHYRNENYPLALSYFQRSSLINPFYASNHLMMGYISMLQGHRTKSVLSYLTYLAINPDRNSTLVFLDNLTSDAVRKEGSIKPFTDNSHFTYYDDLLRSKAALDERFEQAVDFNATIIKQSELLFSKLKFVENGNEFWMEYYVPFYTRLSQEKLIPDFLYYILQSTDNEEVIKWIEKNEKEKTAWVSIANSDLKQNRARNEAVILDEQREYSFWYFDSNTLSAIGNQIDDDTRIGPWVFFSENGQMNARGKYNQLGQKTGDWAYYHDNGRLSRKEVYKDDIIIQPAQYYHEDGALSIVAHYKEGNLDGPLEYYYDCNQIREEVPFESGTKHGKGRRFFETGQLKVDYEMKNGVLSGDYLHYYKNGQVNKKYFIDSGRTDGPYLSYYIDGNKNEVGQYVDEMSSGDWIGYHQKGNIRYEGSFINDFRSGTWKYYHSNGKISDVISYDAQGEQHGPYETYNTDGILTDIALYNHGWVQGYQFFDLEGKIIHQAQDTLGNLEYQGYYPNGSLSTRGRLENGKLNGPYSTYFKNGNTLIKSFMVDDQFHGDYEEYYSTGQIYVRCKYEKGSKNGPYKQYFKNGQVVSEGWYINDQQEQLWRRYHPDGALDQQTYYIAGKAHGWMHHYAPENSIQTSYKFDMDVLVGQRQYDTLGNIYHEQSLEHGSGVRVDKCVSGDTIFKMEMKCGQLASDYYNYYPDGRIQSNQQLKDGMYNGNYQAYDKEGKIEIKGSYVNNEKHGFWQWFHSNGQLKTEYYYQNNQVGKDLKRFYYNGQLESVCSYSEDQRNGSCAYYDQFGELQLIKIYKDDDLISYINIQTQDTIAFIDKGPFIIQSNFKNGKLAAVQNFTDGKFDGVITFYNHSGVVAKSMDYKSGDMHGLLSQYYSNGNVHLEINYEFDLQHGLEKEYYENGKLKRVTPYQYDDMNGTEIIYDLDGSIKNRTHYRNDEIY